MTHIHMYVIILSNCEALFRISRYERQTDSESEVSIVPMCELVMTLCWSHTWCQWSHVGGDHQGPPLTPILGKVEKTRDPDQLFTFPSIYCAQDGCWAAASRYFSFYPSVCSTFHIPISGEGSGLCGSGGQTPLQRIALKIKLYIYTNIQSVVTTSVLLHYGFTVLSS